MGLCWGPTGQACRKGPGEREGKRVWNLELHLRYSPQQALGNHIHLLRDGAQLCSAHGRSSPQVGVGWGDQILQAADVTLGKEAVTACAGDNALNPLEGGRNGSVSQSAIVTPVAAR